MAQLELWRKVMSELRPDVKASTRLEVLHEVAHAIAAGFGADTKSLEAIRKGILERQLIKAAEFSYAIPTGKTIGRLAIKIDWLIYLFQTRSSDDNHLEMDSKLPVSEQMPEVYGLLMLHSRQLRAAFSIPHVETRCHLRDEICANKADSDDALAFLGAPPGKPLEWMDGSGSSPQPEFSIRYSSEHLPELEVVIEHLKPLP
jgi:hypothetical protein